MTLLIRKIGANGLLAALFLLGTVGQAGSGKPAEKAPSTAEVRDLMFETMTVLAELQKYSVSEKNFADKKNGEEIKKLLERLGKLSTQVHSRKVLQSPGYRISGEALDDHVQEVLRVFEEGRNKEFARWMLGATPFVCISCHTQKDREEARFWRVKGEDLSGPPFDRAEFLFATHNYVPALDIYNQLIRTYSGVNSGQAHPSNSQLDTALKRKLMYFVRVARDFKVAQAEIKKDLANKNLPVGTRQNMRNWLLSLAKVATIPAPDKMSASKVIAGAAKVFGKDDDKAQESARRDLVTELFWSGALYRVMQRENEPTIEAQLLYWLGVADHSLNREFFFSLGNTYLKDCILRFPGEAIAKKCYQELEDEMKFMYSGSRGVDLPDEIEGKLKNYRDRLGIKKRQE